MGAIVAIVGRPNVGKSTLFNRILGRRQAIVEDFPGVTRDRNYAEVTRFERPFTLVDTGGFEPASDDRLLTQMREQSQLAMEEADVILFTGDAFVDHPAFGAAVIARVLEHELGDTRFTMRFPAPIQADLLSS